MSKYVKAVFNDRKREVNVRVHNVYAPEAVFAATEILKDVLENVRSDELRKEFIYHICEEMKGLLPKESEGENG